MAIQDACCSRIFHGVRTKAVLLEGIEKEASGYGAMYHDNHNLIVGITSLVRLGHVHSPGCMLDTM